MRLRSGGFGGQVSAMNLMLGSSNPEQLFILMNEGVLSLDGTVPRKE